MVRKIWIPEFIQKKFFLTIRLCRQKIQSLFCKILECWLAINGYVLSLTRFMDGLLDTLFYQVWLYLAFLDTIQIFD